MYSSLDTYLAPCLHQGKTTRWADATMPVAVYIAPFHWYEAQKQRQADIYRQMILDALGAWRHASQHRFSFRLVSDFRQSQLDIAWRRVDRRSLGHCKYLINEQNVLYSAEIEIGISDGRVHPEYNSPSEVYHTILHEVGHAIGLIGHSDAPGDIMYTPHQYGVCQLSGRDIQTAQWLYTLEPGFDPHLAGEGLGLPETERNMASVLSALTQSAHKASAENVKAQGHESAPVHEQAIHRQQALLDYQGRFFLATQPKKRPRK